MRNAKIVALIAVAAVSAALVSGVQTASAAPARSSSHGSFIADNEPPAGWNALTATSSDLDKYGFPPRPSDPAQLENWKYNVSQAKVFVPADPIQSTVVHPLLSHAAKEGASDPVAGAGNHTSYSSNWAGYIANASGTYVSAEWKQPSVSGTSGADASFWTGFGASDIIQAGADSIVGGGYKFWTEDYPANTVWEGPTLGAGDTIWVNITYHSNKTATYYLADITRGTYSSFTNSTPYVQLTSADFINELVGPVTSLPKFSQTGIFYPYVGSTLLGSLRNTKMVMTTTGGSGGTVRSTPGALESSSGAWPDGFTITWSHS
jgi:Peptidase A4 family